MERAEAPQEDGWLGDLRKEKRWKEGRLATVSLRGSEWPACTGDLSLGGAKLAIHGAVPTQGEAVGVTIAFENRLVHIPGTVLHVTKRPWGSIVGVVFEETAHTYLARRLLAQPR